jgi:hypothetical protein
MSVTGAFEAIVDRVVEKSGGRLRCNMFSTMTSGFGDDTYQVEANFASERSVQLRLREDGIVVEATKKDGSLFNTGTVRARVIPVDLADPSVDPDDLCDTILGTVKDMFGDTWPVEVISVGAGLFLI